MRGIVQLFVGTALLSLAIGVHATEPVESAPTVVAHVAAQEVACDSGNCASQPAALEASDGSGSPMPVRQVGEATRSLLQLQAAGTHASSQSYPMTGAVAAKVYERYVNSFAHPIPEQLASAIAKSSK